MSRNQPVLKVSTEQQRIQNEQKIHQDHLKSIKPVVKIKAPEVYPHLKSKRGKQKLEEERLLEIERENQILLNRMKRLSKKPTFDNSPPKHTIKSKRQIQSEKERIAIEKENETLAKSLLQLKPRLDNAKFEKEWEENANHMRRISRFQNPIDPQAFPVSPRKEPNENSPTPATHRSQTKKPSPKPHAKTNPKPKPKPAQATPPVDDAPANDEQQVDPEAKTEETDDVKPQEAEKEDVPAEDSQPSS
ncbi:putative KIAA1430 like protein [Blattamonas nauphoetae]|uniref:KIAA1430 like protein n=1 Tax=Blattamonas nauphoetae TaxID=2049346 RepID=A0ABQ9WTP7_9EUKA|nr:putative KIAA1430 like protein [Blattamonas nauphoetae]